eukprot:628348_1
MAALSESSSTGEDGTAKAAKPTPEDPVSDTGDSGVEYTFKSDDTHYKKVPSSKLPRIPLAPRLHNQNPLPRCGEDHEPPECYHQTDWYKFKLMTFDPSTQYDFLMNTHGKVRWFDVTSWKDTPKYKAARAEKKRGRRMNPYYGHQSMLTSVESELVRDQATSPVIYGGEFLTGEDGKIRLWNGGSGHFRLKPKPSLEEIHKAEKRFEDAEKRYVKSEKRYKQKHEKMGQRIATLLGIDYADKFVVKYAHQIDADTLLDLGVDYDTIDSEEKHEFAQSIVDGWIRTDKGREPYPYVPSHHEIHDQGYNDYELYVFGGAVIVSLFLIFCIGLAFGIVICWGCRQRKELEERKASEEDFNP